MSRVNGPGRALADAQGVRGLPITLDKLRVQRGAATLLRDVDLAIPARGRTIVLGANGAGKSTLLRVMHGLVVPTNGRITWGGRTSPPAGQAMVFQRPILLRRSAAANVAYALRLAGVPSGERRARMARALAAAGLAGLAHRAARTLSGGEQ